MNGLFDHLTRWEGSSFLSFPLFLLFILPSLVDLSSKSSLPFPIIGEWPTFLDGEKMYLLVMLDHCIFSSGRRWIEWQQQSHCPDLHGIPEVFGRTCCSGQHLTGVSPENDYVFSLNTLLMI